MPDARGQRVKLSPLTLSARRRFIKLQAFISEVQAGMPDLTVSDLYDADDDFKCAMDECLALYGLSPDNVSLAILVQLFFTYEGAAGLCWQLDFSPRQKEGKLLDPDQDPYHHAIAAVWSFMPTLSLTDVMGVIEAVPWQDLEGIVEARNIQAQEADPNYRPPVTEEQVETFVNSFTNGTFSGMPVGGMLSRVLS